MAAEFSHGGEREALVGFLDWQRNALIRKARGLSDANARSAPTASSLSLLGLIKHSTVWEARWFEGVVAGRALDDGWPDTEHDVQDGSDFSVGDDDTVEEWVARYEDAMRDGPRRSSPASRSRRAVSRVRMSSTPTCASWSST